MEEYKSILKLIDETLERNNDLLEHYRKAATVYETKIAELRTQVETLEAANRELIKKIEKGDCNND